MLIKVEVKVGNNCDNGVSGRDNNSNIGSGGGGGGDGGDKNNDDNGDSDDRSKGCQWIKIINGDSNYYNLLLNNLNNFKIINM